MEYADVAVAVCEVEARRGELPRRRRQNSSSPLKVPVASPSSWALSEFPEFLECMYYIRLAGGNANGDFQRGSGVWAPAARKFSATRLYLADDDRDIGVFHWHSTGVLEFGTILECLAWHFSQRPRNAAATYTLVFRIL